MTDLDAQRSASAKDEEIARLKDEVRVLRAEQCGLLSRLERAEAPRAYYTVKLDDAVIGRFVAKHVPLAANLASHGLYSSVDYIRATAHNPAPPPSDAFTRWAIDNMPAGEVCYRDTDPGFAISRALSATRVPDAYGR